MGIGPLYPGSVHRASLINFCQDKVRTIQDELRTLEVAISNPRVSDKDYEVLFDAMSKHLGAQLAYRAVTEWARENQQPEPYMERKMTDDN